MADKRRGPRKPRTKRELDKLAEITPDDVERARERWRQDAPAQFRDLLDAEPDDSPSP